jgi:hypothetical protein
MRYSAHVDISHLMSSVPWRIRASPLPWRPRSAALPIHCGELKARCELRDGRLEVQASAEVSAGLHRWIS